MFFWPPTDSSHSTLSDVLNKLGTKIRTNIDEEVPVVAKDLFPYSPLWGGYNVMLMLYWWGYTLGRDFWTFPYDWRQSNEISGQMLTRFIEKKIQGKWDSVDIVCHSMGGIVTRAAYKFGVPIKRTVYIASPHFGNPLAYFALNPEISTASASKIRSFPPDCQIEFCYSLDVCQIEESDNNNAKSLVISNHSFIAYHNIQLWKLWCFFERIHHFVRCRQ